MAARRGGGHFCDEPYVINTVKNKNTPTTKSGHPNKGQIGWLHLLRSDCKWKM
ncbi:MAG: hypothetical protein HZB54_07865 [Deltaproteobacteria bacterium]|nr:hypothetical protein [Deltaproteobacteria bacterium]